MDVPGWHLPFTVLFFASFYQLLINGLDGDKRRSVFLKVFPCLPFLLLIGKYLEFKAKSKAILSNANLNKKYTNHR